MCLGLRQTQPSTAATTHRLFQRAKGCDSTYLLVCDQGVSSIGPPLGVYQEFVLQEACRVSQSRQTNTPVRLNNSVTQSTSWSITGQGFRPGICVLCWPAGPYLIRPWWQGQTAHKVASLRRSSQHKGLRPVVEGPCIGAGSQVDLGKAPS